MANLLYQYPSDQRLSGSVTITPSTEDTEYPKANLYDSNPAKPFKFTATTGNIVFNFGSAVAVNFFAIIHHNLTAALSNVAIQANSSDAWGAPPLNQTITVPSYEQDGFPVNPFVDLSAISNTYQYWRLNFGTANAAAIALGEVWFGATKRTLTKNVRWGMSDTVERNLIEHVTDYGVSTIYDLGSKIRSYSFEIASGVTAMNEVETWWDACHGRALPMVIALDPSTNDCRMVRFADPVRTISRETSNHRIFTFGLREVSRGLVL